MTSEHKWAWEVENERLRAEVERLRAEYALLEEKLHNAIRLRELALSKEAPPLTLDWTYDTAAGGDR